MPDQRGKVPHRSNRNPAHPDPKTADEANLRRRCSQAEIIERGCAAQIGGNRVKQMIVPVKGDTGKVRPETVSRKRRLSGGSGNFDERRVSTAIGVDAVKKTVVGIQRQAPDEACWKAVSQSNRVEGSDWGERR